ncbi:MAG: Uma2 family endonuclease [Solirubrobacteraceae bacterium]
MLESFVAMGLRRHADWTDRPVELFHYRDRRQREVDVVIERAKRPQADGRAKRLERRVGSLRVPPPTATGATLPRMRTLLPDPPPADLAALLQRRRRLGLDRHDEVWEGVIHVAPAPHSVHADIQLQLAEMLGPVSRDAGLHALGGEFNIGDAQDYRVPDAGILRRREHATWLPTAALVIEILSPEDETLEKLPFYAARHVDELLIVDPQQRSVDWLALEHGDYHPIEKSRLVDLSVAQLAQQIDWP